MRRVSALRRLLPFLGAAAAVALFRVVGAKWFHGWVLDLGSVSLPSARYNAFLLQLAVFGAIATVLVCAGLYGITGGARARRLGEELADYSDRRFLVLATVVAFCLPMLVRTWVLHGAPLTDDESAYRFMAQLLASGRLTAHSPPLKLFFDRAFMVNDGRMYSVYFIGWPALLAPGMWIHAPGIMNPIYFALGLPPLYWLLRRLAGSGWAKAGALLYLAAPLSVIGAAALGSHPSCLFALVWLAWLATRSRDADASPWVHAGVAVAFGVAFFNRPLTAIGIGLPFLVLWGIGLVRRPGRARTLAALAFGVPAAVLAALFLLVNRVQTGHAFTVAYQAGLSYARQNGYRFSLWSHAPPGGTAGFRFGMWLTDFANTAVAIVRLNFDLFGWVSAFVLAAFAGFSRKTWVYWASAGLFIVANLFTSDSGIDSYGPVHYAEIVLPVIVLSVLGMARMTELLGERLRRVPVLAMLSLVAVASATWLPVRLAALSRISAAIEAPFEAVRAEGLSNAVVFTPRPFVSGCRAWPTRSFVFWRPNNDPDLHDDVLWANHIDVPSDRRLMARFPKRKGYVMEWTRDCRVVLLPLDALKPGQVPRGRIGGSGRGLGP